MTTVEFITVENVNALRWRSLLYYYRAGPSRAAGGGFVDRLPYRGAFIESQCVCKSVPTLSWGQ